MAIAPRWARREILMVAVALLLCGLLFSFDFTSAAKETHRPGSAAKGLSLLQATKTLQRHKSPLFASLQTTDETSDSSTGHLVPLGLLSSNIQTAFRSAQETFRGYIPYDGPMSTSPQEPPLSRQEVLVRNFVGSIVYILFACFFAYLYIACFKPPKIDESLIEAQRDGHGFQFGICDTTKCDIYLVLCSCCCPFVRWPATVSNEKLALITFWPAVIIFSVCSSGILGGLLSLILLGVQIYFRQKIRAKYNVENGTCMTVFEDCLVWTFCYPCAIGQEARQIEYVEARETNA